MMVSGGFFIVEHLINELRRLSFKASFITANSDGDLLSVLGEMINIVLQEHISLYQH